MSLLQLANGSQLRANQSELSYAMSWPVLQSLLRGAPETPKMTSFNDSEIFAIARSPSYHVDLWSTKFHFLYETAGSMPLSSVWFGMPELDFNFCVCVALFFGVVSVVLQDPRIEFAVGGVYLLLGGPFLLATQLASGKYFEFAIVDQRRLVIMSLVAYSVGAYFGGYAWPFVLQSVIYLNTLLLVRYGPNGVVYGAPIVEELAKQAFGPLYAYSELVLTWGRQGPVRLLPFCMHLFCDGLHPLHSIVLHLLWNWAFQSWAGMLVYNPDHGELPPAPQRTAVPRWNPTLSLEALAESRDDNNLAEHMRIAGWPEYLVARATANRRGFRARLPDVFADEEPRRRPDAPFEWAKPGRRKHKAVPRFSGVNVKRGGKGFSEHFQVHKPAFIPKERRLLRLNHGPLTHWRFHLNSVWWELFETITKPNQKICANLSAEMILMSQVPRHVLDREGPMARLYIHEFKASPQERVHVPMTLDHVLISDKRVSQATRPPAGPFTELVERVLYVGGIPCRTPGELGKFALTFKRHKPFFRMAEAFLDGAKVGLNGAPLDRARLQAQIDAVTKKVSAGVAKREEIVDVHYQSGGLDPEAPEFVPAPRVTSADSRRLWRQLVERRIQQGGAFCAMRDLELVVAPQVEYQGGAMSRPATEAEPFVIKHELQLRSGDSELKDVKEIATELIDMATDMVPERRVRQAASLAFMLASVYRSEKILDQFIALGAYVASDQALWDATRARVTSLVKPQAEGEDDTWYKYFTSLVFECGLCNMASELTGSFGAMIREFSGSLAASFRKEFFIDAGRRAAQTVVDGLLAFAKRLRNCVKAKSLRPLLGDDWDPVRWSELAAFITNDHVYMTIDTPQAAAYRREKVLAKLYPADWGYSINAYDLVDRLARHIESGRALAKVFAKDQVVLALIQENLRKLVVLHSSTLIRVRGAQERPAPFMILFYGVPGGGKTKFAAEVRSAIARRFGYPRHAVYQWQLGVNFQSGLDHTTRMIAMDDVDQGVAAPVAGQRTHAQEVVALVNNAPYPVEESESALKGSTNAMPDILTYTTNFPTAKVVKNLGDPFAFWRRVHLYVEFKAKKEFSLGNGILDSAKAGSSPTWEMFEISVRRFDPLLVSQKNQHALPFTAGETMSVSEFMRMMLKEVAAYKARQNELIEQSTAPDYAVCPSCFLETKHKKCSCDGTVVPPVPTKHDKDFEEAFIVGHLAQAELEEEDEPTIEEHLPGRATTWWDVILYPLRWMQRVCGMMLWIMAVKFRLASVAKRVEDALFSPAAVGVVAAMIVVAGLVRMYTKKFQARENNATGVLGPSWTRAEQKFTPGLPPTRGVTWTYDELVQAVRKCSVPIKNQANKSCTGVFLSLGVLMVPAHMLRMYDTLEYEVQGRTLTVTRTELNSAVSTLHSEVVLVHVPEAPPTRGVSVFVLESLDQSVAQYDELHLCNGDWTKKAVTNCVKIKGGEYVSLTDVQTVDGDCGAMYVARHNSGWRIVAMHYALGTDIMGTTSSMGALLTRDSLRAAVNRLGLQMQSGICVAPSMSKALGAISVDPYPPKSEYWAAYSHSPVGFPIGTVVPAPSGNTLKTKLKLSLLASRAAPLAAQWTGQENYWSLPTFKGGMKEGRWQSAFTEALSYENRAQVDGLAMCLATMDYLNGAMSLEREGYSYLSEEAMIAGVPGSYVRPMNMRTSVGPPFSGPKTLFYAKIEDGCYAREEMWQIFDYTMEILRDGDVPCPFVVWTLKDEGVKPSKWERTFNVFASAVNGVDKMHFAPIHSFLRANPHFFESFVGIDITGPDIAILITHLKRVDPELANVVEKDIKAMDASFHGAHWAAIARVYYAIAWMLGLPPSAPMALMLGIQHSVHCIKGDLFHFCRNPSGNDATVQINGIGLSLGERVVYYNRRLQEPMFAERALKAAMEWQENFLESPVPQGAFCEELDYRKRNSLATFGDDSLKTSLDRLVATEQDDWLRWYGFRVTDGQKEPVLVERPILGCTYLKRGFVWDAELRSYIAPLSLKSLARTLMIKKHTSLSDLDNAATAVSEVMRELVLHGQTVYEDFRALAAKWAKEVGFEGNPNYKSKPYEHWRLQMVEGKFSTWEDSRGRLEEAEVSQVDLQSKMEENVKMVNDPNSGSASSNQQSMGTEETHPVGRFEGDGQTSRTPWDATRPTQKIEVAQLGDYLSRFVEVAVGTISDSDPQFDVLTNWDYTLWLANTNVQDKLRSYTYFRGTLKVKVVFSIPGNAMGLYTVTALCNAGRATEPGVNSSILGVLTYTNCMQTDHYCVVDCATTSVADLTLPFVHPQDYVTQAQLADIWKVSLVCLQPLGTAIPAGNTVATYRVFMAVEDWDMIAPRYQAKQGKMLDKVKQTHEKLKGMGISKTANMVADFAGKASMIPVIAPFAAPVAMAAKGISEVASWFGYTRETAEHVPSSMVIKSLSNVAHYDGEDAGEVASLSVANALSISPEMTDGHAEDCSAFSSLFDRHTLTAAATWEPSAAPGTNILSLPVSPFHGLGTATTIRLTPAGYVGLPFLHWRGDMHYRVFIPVSTIHRGAIQVFWYPDLTLPVGLPVTNVTMNVVHEVTAGKVMDITVGYSRELPMLTRRLLNQTSIVNPKYCNGFLVFRVINPLQSQSDVPVSILVFARAGSNMEFACPTDSIEPPGSTSNLYMPTAVVLQAADGDEEAEEDVPIELTTPTGTFPVAEVCAGERVCSARALMQKPSILFHGPPTTSSRDMLPHLGFLPREGSDIFGWTPTMSYFGYYRALFVGIACSERFRMVVWDPDAATSKELLGAAPAFNGSFAMISPVAPMQVLTDSASYECVIPYYNPRKFSLGFCEYNYIGPTTLFDVPRGTRIYQDQEQWTAWHSAGPDLRIVRFRQVPIVFISAGRTPTYPDRA